MWGVHGLEIFLMTLSSCVHPVLACAFLQGKVGGVAIIFPGSFVVACLGFFFFFCCINMLFNPSFLCRPSMLCSIRKYRK